MTTEDLHTAAAALGRKGGLSTSAAKRRAARANANKPPKPGKEPRGRPRKETTMPPKNGREVIETIGDYEIVRVDNTPHRGHVEAWGESEAIKVFLTDTAIRRGRYGVEEEFDSVDDARKWIAQH